MTKRNEHPSVIERARPVPVQQSEELQHYGTVARLISISFSPTP